MSQWLTALTLVRERIGDDALVSSLGIEFETRERDDRRVLAIAALDPQGAAAAQGLQRGDVVLAVSDRPYDPDTWPASIALRRAGQDVHVTYERAGERHTTMLQVGLRRQD